MLEKCAKALMCALAAMIIGSLLGSQRASAQDFTTQTFVTPAAGGQYSYMFTLSYDQAGGGTALTDNIWEWSFFLEPNTPEPTTIVAPSGWQAIYTPATGEFDWYTEGPNGFGSGDFGPNTVAPGTSLGGFGLTSPLAPDTSVAFAYDRQFNADATVATLPVGIAAVPEPGGAAVWTSGAIVTGIFLARRRLRRGRAKAAW